MAAEALPVPVPASPCPVSLPPVQAAADVVDEAVMRGNGGVQRRHVAVEHRRGPRNRGDRIGVRGRDSRELLDRAFDGFEFFFALFVFRHDAVVVGRARLQDGTGGSGWELTFKAFQFSRGRRTRDRRDGSA